MLEKKRDPQEETDQSSNVRILPNSTQRHQKITTKLEMVAHSLMPILQCFQGHGMGIFDRADIYQLGSRRSEYILYLLLKAQWKAGQTNSLSAGV